MKRIEIFFSSREGDKRGIVQKRESPEVQVDFTSIENRFKDKGDKITRHVDALRAYWESEGEPRLFNPLARVLLIPRAAAGARYGELVVGEEDSVECVAMLVWTIGEPLEVESVRWMAKGKNMAGMLLDVTGSLCLYAMHGALLDWIEARVAKPEGYSLRGEFYPGAGAASGAMMEAIQTTGETRALIGVDALHGGMLHPRKSQCSFVHLGKGASKYLKEYAPCEPCSENHCLYRQMGGCHAK